MPKLKRPRVALLFLGGSVIDERGRRGDVVNKPKDVEPWMAQMGEMDIIATTEGFFVGSAQGPIGLPDWAAVAKTIDEHYRAFDGFVVIHDVPTMAVAAVVLSQMLEKLEKPVALVGSPLRTSAQRRQPTTVLVGAQEFGAKASIINAVQVAASDAGEVVVVFGSTIFRGRSVSTVIKPVPTMVGEVLGKVDFGIRFFGEQVKRAKRAFRIRPDFDTNVAVVELVPGLDVASLDRQAEHHHGLFLSGTEGLGFDSSILTSLSTRVRLPIGLYLASAQEKNIPPNIIPFHDPSRTSALLRFMWALGQGSDPKKLRKLLDGETK